MTADPLEEQLVCEGWPITGTQLSDFIGKPISGIQDVYELRKQLLDADMHEYASPLLSDHVNKQLGEFKGPLVVQIIKQRNVSYPKYHEVNHTDGLIKIQLSDGFSSIQALLFEPIPKLNAETPPGTKLCLVGKIPVENGMLLINETNCQVLGGSVEKMIEKWDMEKNWLHKAMRTTESNAPKWIPFSKQQLQKLCLPVNSINKMFRANDVINGLNKKPTDVRGDDFSAARRAQIELVVENNAIKKFARSQLKPKLLEDSSSTTCNNVSKKDQLAKSRPDGENTNRRFVRDDKKQLSSVHRPSNPPTLYDFVQSKVSMFDDSPRHNREVEKIEASVQIAEIQDRMRSNKFRLRNRQNPDNSIGSREISNSNRYRNQSNWRSAQDKFQSDVVYEGFRPKCVSVSTTNKELSALQISPADEESEVINKDHNVPKQTLFFGNKNHRYQQNPVYRPMHHEQQQQQQQQSFDNTVNGGVLSVWKIGDKCLAPWSDGQFYPSLLVSMGPADMCTIEYDEYGNRSSVPLGVLLPFQTF